MIKTLHVLGIGLSLGLGLRLGLGLGLGMGLGLGLGLGIHIFKAVRMNATMLRAGFDKITLSSLSRSGLWSRSGSRSWSASAFGPLSRSASGSWSRSGYRYWSCSRTGSIYR